MKSLRSFPQFTLAAMLLLNSTQILASEESPVPVPPSSSSTVNSEQTESAAREEIQGPVEFISDGQPLSIEDIGLTFAAPKDWLVRMNSGGLSLITEEPEPAVREEGQGVKTKFKRNITVATIQHPSPIDARRLEELKVELNEKLAKGSGVQNFTILDGKLFDYRLKNDGILIYSGFQLGEFNMMQLHILVSDAERQFLMTYTDLAERFEQAGPTFQEAWKAMAGAQLSTPAPKRFENMVRYGVVAGIFLTLFVAWRIIRRLRMKRRMNHAGDEELFEDDDATWQGSAAESTKSSVSDGDSWNLDNDEDLYADEDEAYSF